MKIKFLEYSLNIMPSDSWKSVFKWPWKTLKKILLKSTKNMKLSGLLSDLTDLNYPSYQLFEATFQKSVFPKL